MTNEDAKRIYNDAVAQATTDPAKALALLDELDAARPNSRQVTFHRGICLVRMGRLDLAQECLDKLRGKLEEDKLAELEAAIGAKRALVAADTAGGDTVKPAPASTHGENVLLVESTFPVSTSEATVTGHVTSGVFHLGDTVTVTSEGGLPLLAPIRRIGTADAPLKLVREGQKAILLLEVEPHHIRPGGRIVSRAAAEAYAKTMVVSARAEDSGPEELSPEILRVERDIKAGNFSEALTAVEGYLVNHPQSKTAYRLKAKVLLEAPEEMRNITAALDCVRRAYELGGAEDPAVIDTLAWAMAENGEGEHGLRFLERQASLTNDPRAAAAIAKRITEYRERFNMGHVWEFSDTYGDVVFETRDLAEAARAMKSNTIPRNGKVRRDRVGDWRDIEQALSPEHPDIRAIFAKPASSSNSPALIGFVVVAVIAAAAAAFFLLR